MKFTGEHGEHLLNLGYSAADLLAPGGMKEHPADYQIRLKLNHPDDLLTEMAFLDALMEYEHTPIWKGELRRLEEVGLFLPTFRILNPPPKDLNLQKRKPLFLGFKRIFHRDSDGRLIDMEIIPWPGETHLPRKRYKNRLKDPLVDLPRDYFAPPPKGGIARPDNWRVWSEALYHFTKVKELAALHQRLNIIVVNPFFMTPSKYNRWYKENIYRESEDRPVAILPSNKLFLLMKERLKGLVDERILRELRLCQNCGQLLPRHLSSSYCDDKCRNARVQRKKRQRGRGLPLK